MANWNKRSSYKKDANPSSDSLTPWEKMRKDASVNQAVEKTAAKKKIKE